MGLGEFGGEEVTAISHGTAHIQDFGIRGFWEVGEELSKKEGAFLPGFFTPLLVKHVIPKFGGVGISKEILDGDFGKSEEVFWFGGKEFFEFWHDWFLGILNGGLFNFGAFHEQEFSPDQINELNCMPDF